MHLILSFLLHEKPSKTSWKARRYLVLTSPTQTEIGMLQLSKQLDAVARRDGFPHAQSRHGSCQIFDSSIIPRLSLVPLRVPTVKLCPTKLGRVIVKGFRERRPRPVY